MSGLRMEANVHIITGLVTAAQNIYRCVERAGLHVDDIVLEPLASSYAVLDDEEKEVGVALIDSNTGRFLNVNQRACDIARLTRRQMMATTFMHIAHPDDRQANLEHMEKLKSVYALTELETNVTTCMAEAGTLLEQVGIHISEQLAAKKLSRSPISKEDLHV